MGGRLAVDSRQKGSAGSPPEADEVLEELERILASGDFDASPRSRAFLRFIVEETLAGRQEGLTQDAIATRVFDRREDFDPTVDPIVRIQAGRLRRSLERYYLLAGAGDPVRIELPRGAYVPVLRWATPAEEPASATDAGRLDGPRRRLAHRRRERRARRSRPGARRRGGPVPGSPGRRAGPVPGRARRASARPAAPGDVSLRRREVRSLRAASRGTRGASA